ncbi:MAG: GIY-YIG nuclease family protein [Candidatus Omnitrophota bacterium]|jgi:putative endonuclease
MFYVYVLRSTENGRCYVGYTANLERRLREHELKNVHSTARLSNPDLIYYEAFVSEEDARRREQYLKTTKGKAGLKLILRYTFAASK